MEVAARLPDVCSAASADRYIGLLIGLLHDHLIVFSWLFGIRICFVCCCLSSNSLLSAQLGLGPWALTRWDAQFHSQKTANNSEWLRSRQIMARSPLVKHSDQLKKPWSTVMIFYIYLPSLVVDGQK